MFDTLFVSDDLSHGREVENVGKIYRPFFRYFFIGPRSDHSLRLSVTDSLSHELVET